MDKLTAKTAIYAMQKDAEFEARMAYFATGIGIVGMVLSLVTVDILSFGLFLGIAGWSYKYGRQRMRLSALEIKEFQHSNLMQE